jgi:GNAT superfamily N-acetyltransferase
MKVRIAQAEADDRDALKLLQRVCQPGDPMIDPTKDHWWIGRDEQGVAVCYGGARVYKANGEHALLLTAAGVIPSARGQKLQRRLIAARVRFARDEEIPIVWTYTATHNVASANSLIASGFKRWIPRSWAGEAVKPGDPEWEYWERKVPPPKPEAEPEAAT